MESEATGIQTNEAAVGTTPEVMETVTEQSVDTPVTEEATTTEEAATNPFSKESLDWQGIDISDDQKDALVNRYSSWFKDAKSANEYLKAVAEANKQRQEADEKLATEKKEAQARKIADLESGWEKSLKTDANYGRDYEGNNKRVNELMKKYWSEEEVAMLNKFGYSKFDIVRKGLLRMAQEREDAKVAGIGQPAPITSGQPTDRFGNTMFDFTKKQ